MPVFKATLFGQLQVRLLSFMAPIFGVSAIFTSPPTISAIETHPALIADALNPSNARLKAPANSNWTPEMIAWRDATSCIREGRIAELKEILATNPDFVTRTFNEGATLLHMACAADQTEAAELLMQRGSDRLAKRGQAGETPLHDAARCDSINCVNMLLQDGVDINIPCEGPRAKEDHFAPYASPLDLAAAAGALRVVRLLLDNGAKLDINPVDHPYSALHRAAEGRYVAISKRPYSVNGEARKTAFGNVSVFKLLLKHGAHLDDVDYKGNTPFHVAVRRAADETVEYLLAARQFDIDVESPGQSGFTPLQLAVQGLRPDNQKNVTLVIELLLKRGADRHKIAGPPDQQMTAFDLAAERKCPESILKLLRP